MMSSEMIKQCSVVLTRECNLRCGFCYVKEAGYCSSNMISLNDLKKVVDFCCEAEVKYIFFTGGEPTLYPHMNEILKYINMQRHHISVAIATNGIVLSDAEKCKALIDNGVEYIDVSIKGTDSEKWLSATGYDGFLLQQKAIRNLSELSIDFTCSMVINPDNVFSVCDAVELALSNGAKQFSFTFVIENNKSNDDGVTYLKKHNPLQLIDNFVLQIDRLNSITNEWWIEYSFPICMYTKQQLDLLDGRLASPCQIHKRNAVTFDTNLNLLPCDMYFNEKLGKLGDDFSSAEDLTDYMNGNLYKPVMDSISQLPSPVCEKCENISRCYGGCPVLWKNYSFEDLGEYISLARE